MDFPRYLAIYNWLDKGEHPTNADEAMKGKVRNWSRRYEARAGKLWLKKARNIEVLHRESLDETVERIHAETHAGVTNTWRRVRLHYEGYQLFARVKELVGACEICQKRAPRRSIRTNPHRPIETPETPFYMVGCDAVGPLPLTKKRNRYLLVAVDYLTRWPIAAAVTDISQETTSEFMLDYLVAQHGVPRYLLTDRGSNFTSAYVKEFLERLGCKRLTTTAYRPQVNGMCERMNRTITQTLAKLMQEKGYAEDEWDQCLSAALLAVRINPNDTTRQSPALLLYGQELRTPATWIAPEGDFVEGSPDDTAMALAQRARAIRETVDPVRLKAKADSAKRQRASERRYNRTVTPVTYERGDLVLMRDPVPSGKFANKWIGPLRVGRVNNNGTYRLEGLDSRRIEGAVNGDNLRNWNRRTEFIPDVVAQRAEEQLQHFVDRVDTAR